MLNVQTEIICSYKLEKKNIHLNVRSIFTQTLHRMIYIYFYETSILG